MSAPWADHGEQQQQQPPPPQQQPPPQQAVYILTEEERQVMKECAHESFWYRSVPFSIISMVATQAFLHRGKLTTKFSSLLKVASAGATGYIAGKMSYVGACRQKFMKLENSPLVEMFQQRRQHQTQIPQRTSQLEIFDADIPTRRRSFAPIAAEPPSTEYSSEYESGAAEVPFSASMSESSPTGIEDQVLVDPEPIQGETTKKKAVTYEELREHNRGLHQKAALASSRAPVQETKPRKAVLPEKKNIYGDVWEE